MLTGTLDMCYNLCNRFRRVRSNYAIGGDLVLYEYLMANYKEDEPIFMADINLPAVSDNTLRQMFKKLCDAGKIKRFDNGIYYIPSSSRLKGSVGIAPETVARYKYIERSGKIDGYYSGFTFANMLGLTTQVPYTMEIVSNSAGGNYRVVSLGGRKIALRRPRTEITGKNRPVLQFLDFLKDYEEYVDEDSQEVSVRLEALANSAGITKDDIDQYISLFPEKVYKNYYDLRLYDVLA